MEAETTLILIAGMAAVTYLTRVPLWLIARRGLTVHTRLDRFLDQIPIAAFAAIVFPSVLQPGGETQIAASNLYLYAAGVTVAVGVATRGRLLSTLLAGTVAAVLLRIAFG